MKVRSCAITEEEREYYSLTKKVWDTFAPLYDIVVGPISKVRSDVVDFADAKNGSRILDVATGTGKQAFAFASAGRGYDVVGIDISEAMLEIAVKKNRYRNLKFRVADAADIPFADDSFDVCCISFGLHDMPLSIREKVLREMVRVTRPNGFVVIVDYGLPKSVIGRRLVYNFVRLYEGEYYRRFVKSDLEALVRKSGIRIEEEIPVLRGAGRILKGIKVVPN